VLDHRAAAIVMAVVTLIFVALWLLSDPKLTIRPSGNVSIVMAACLLAIPSGVWLG